MGAIVATPRMSKPLTSLTVFFSSPSDGEAERGALKTVLNELNRTLERLYGVTLRYLGWPDTIGPGVGADGQSVINRQVGDGYDVYIGVLGSRFGQPTPRASSGTEEEFNLALERFRKDTTSIRLLMYFRRVVSDVFHVDPTQLQKVLAFRESLGPAGVLYRDFDDTGQFTTLVRDHLVDLFADDWDGGCWKRVDLANPPPAVIPSAAPSTRVTLLQLEMEPFESDADELGLFELHDEIERNALILSESAGEVGLHTSEIRRELERRTEEVNRLAARKKMLDGSGNQQLRRHNDEQIKAAVNQAATALTRFAADLGRSLQDFKTGNRGMFESLAQAIALHAEAGTMARLRDEKKQIVSVLAVLSVSIEGVIRFQTAIAGLLALTGSLKAAKKRASSIIGELIAEMQFTVEEGNRIMARIPDEDDR